MAIKKMKLVRASGPSARLNELIRLCCDEGYFHPEKAENFISQSMGYTAFNEESPYQKILHSIRELAEEFSFDPENMVSSGKALVDENTQEYIDEGGHTLH